MITNLSRVMFVIGRLKVATAALAGSWLLVILADVVLAELVPSQLVVPALALGTTIGQTVVAIPLVIVTRGSAAGRRAGCQSRRAGRLAAGVVGRRLGWLSAWRSAASQAGGVRARVPAAGCAIVGFGVVAYLLDDGDLRAVPWREPRLASSTSMVRQRKRWQTMPRLPAARRSLWMPMSPTRLRSNK